MNKVILPCDGGWKHVYPVAIEYTAIGGKPIPGLEDRWAVRPILRKRPCTEDGTPVTFDGMPSEMPEESPTYAVADLLHDEQVQQLFALTIAVVNRLISGDLEPAPEPEPEPEPEEEPEGE